MLKTVAPTLPPREDRLRLLRTVADSIRGMRFETWNFGDSTGFEALLDSSRVLGDPVLFGYAHGWMRAWATRQEPFRRLDCTAPGLAMVDVATETSDSALFEALIRLARYLMSRPMDRGIYDTWDRLCLIPPYGGEALPPREAAWLAEPPNGTCVDCLHFDPPFFTALGIAIEEPELVQAGVDQALAYVRALQQPEGIFDHFFMRGVGQTFGGGWGRGQGWAVLGLLDVHRLLDDHPARDELVASIRLQIDAMLKLQRPDGRWWCVVDDPESGEEGSTAAFMATGFLRAIKQGIYEPAELEGPALLALAAAIDDVDADGHLSNVTAAVMASTRRSHYAHTPRGFLVPWGEGPLALAICEAAELP
jgi:unsaturated rhamnogalacturonyl hydrolase